MAKFQTSSTTLLRQEAEAAARVHADVQAKLAPINAKISAARAQQDDLALAVVLEEPGAQEKHQALGEQISAAEAELKLLQSAERIAVQRSQDAAAARNRAEHADRIERWNAKADKLGEKGAKISEHLKGLSIEFNEALAIADDLRVSFVGKLPPFRALLLLPQYLQEAISVEIWRLHDGQRSSELPGAMPGGEVLVEYGRRAADGISRQAQCPSLVQRLADAKQLANDFMSGKRRDAGGGHDPMPGVPTVTPPTAPEAKPADGLDDLFPAETAAIPSPDDGSDGAMTAEEYTAFVAAEDAKRAALPKRSAAEIQASFPKRSITL